MKKMASKTLGYIFAMIGLIGIAIPLIPQLKSAIPLPTTIPELYITIASLVIVGLGLAIIIKSQKSSGKKKNQKKEVPIYEGKEIVGYRRN